jgi:hypothetical protein
MKMGKQQNLIAQAVERPSRGAARVKTYGDVATEYEFHPESKCAGADGEVCAKQTIGLLQRRHIRVEQIKYIGKESNSLEDVESGLKHSAQSVYTEYPDPQRDEWQTKILPALQQIALNFLVESCTGRLSRRALIDLRAGRSRPHVRNEEMLSGIVKQLGSNAPEPKTKGKKNICLTKTRNVNVSGNENIANSGMRSGRNSV